MKKVITYGTFDVFHYGHFYLLERASAHGDHLTVCVSTKDFNLLKGKVSKLSFAQRCYILQNISFVDCLIAEKTWEQKITDIKRLNIDTFAIGDDHKVKYDFLKEYCEVIYIPRTKGVCSTGIKKLASYSHSRA